VPFVSDVPASTAVTDEPTVRDSLDASVHFFGIKPSLQLPGQWRPSAAGPGPRHAIRALQARASHRLETFYWTAMAEARLGATLPSFGENRSRLGARPGTPGGSRLSCGPDPPVHGDTAVLREGAASPAGAGSATGKRRRHPRAVRPAPREAEDHPSTGSFQCLAKILLHAAGIIQVPSPHLPISRPNSTGGWVTSGSFLEGAQDA